MTKKSTRDHQTSEKKPRRRKQPVGATSTASLVNQQTASHEIISAGAEPYSSQQEDRYRALMAQSPQFFWTINAEGEIVEDVAAWRAYTGQTHEETLGHGWMRAIHKEDRQETARIWEQARAAQSHYQVHFRLRRYDGVYRLFETHGFPIFEKDGTLKGWIGVTVDITERKALEDELKQSEEKFRLTFEQAPVGIAHVGLDGHFLLFNQKFCDIVGCTREELATTSYYDILQQQNHSDDTATSLQESIRPILQGTQAAYTEERAFTRKDGKGIWMNFTITLMRDASGQPLYFIVVVEDISERKRAELAQRIANERLEEFLWLASHELKTPLTTIHINMQVAERLLKNMPGDESAASDELASKLDTLKEMITCASQQVNMLNRLVNDIVDLSRIQANKLELHMRPRLCDLATITQDVIRSQRYVVPERDVRLSIRYAYTQNTTNLPTPIGETEMLIPIHADPDRIGQVITNYLTNALKHSRSHQPVDVRIQVEKEQVTLMVQDYGSGLTAEEQEHIWERFYQVEGAERSSHKDAGLGLGLYISRSIIAWHQGTVGVQSTPGEGATFWFTLPLTRPSTSNHEEPISTIPGTI